MSDPIPPVRRHRWRLVAAIAAAVLLGLPIALVAAALIVFNTAPGQRWAGQLAAHFTHGQVRITGLHGVVPDNLHLAGLRLADPHGTWLVADGVTLRWSPLDLLHGTVHVRLLSADRVQLLRRPAPQPTPAKPAKSSSGLDIAIKADRISLPELDLGAPVAGVAARLAIDAHADLHGLQRGTLAATIRRLDLPGLYTVQAALTDRSIQATLAAREPSRGLLASLAHAPNVGPLALRATVDGPRTAIAIKLALSAGPLRAGADGTIDLPGHAAHLAITANAPAMVPAPGISWTSVAIAGHLDGPWRAPAGQARVLITGLEANGARLAAIDLTAHADRAQASLSGTVSGIALPPPNQALLAGGPLTLRAQANLRDPALPITFSFTQAVLAGDGTARLHPSLDATLHLRVPDLEAIARTLHKDVQGEAHMTIAVAQTAPRTTRVTLDGAMNVTGGADAPHAARGNATLSAEAILAGQDILLPRLALDGATVQLRGSASRRAGVLAADWTLHAAQIQDLVPSLRGAIGMTGHVAGPETDFAARLQLSGTLGTARFAPAPLALAIAASGLPRRPAARITGTATLAGAPASLDLAVDRGADQATSVQITRLAWKSLTLAGTLAMPPGAALPHGTLALGFTRLADLAPLLHQPLVGSLRARVDLPPSGVGQIHLTGLGVGLAGRATIGTLTLAASVRNPRAAPIIDGTLAATGLHAGAITGAAKITLRGGLAALALRTTATLDHLAGATARLDAAATVNDQARTVRLASLHADWKGLALALDHPATVTYAPEIAVDHLAVTASTPGAAPAHLRVNGRLQPTLALTVAARNLTPGLARAFAPSLDAAGVIRLDAQLAGSPARPTGTVRLVASGLRVRSGPASGLPAAQARLTLDLAGAAARIDGALSAGPATNVSLRGTVPLGIAGALDLHVAGGLDLAMLNPILTARGARIRGAAKLDAAITGTPRAPAAQGSFTLAGGDLQDYALGVHLAAIAATIQADGNTVRITRFTAAAGGGTIAAAGTVSLAGAMPVDLTLTARRATPINSDLATATLDADLTVTGTAKQRVTLGGTVHVLRADINIPSQMPATVETLHVRLAGAHVAPPPPAAPALAIPLALTIDAPEQIFLRGRGVNAELGGQLHVAGTAAAPAISGAIELRQGNYSLAGTTLTFTSGKITFNGSHGIDPALDFVASSSTASVTATLTIGGYASAPRISLSSTPELPQDQVLSALLFGQSLASLSPLQLAEIGAALAQISGVGGGGANPLDKLRQGLGLDQLTVGSISNSNPAGGASSTTTTVQGGKYIARGVFLGAKQGVTGQATQAELQIDITKRLKLETDAGSGPGGNTVGLSYQFQY